MGTIAKNLDREIKKGKIAEADKPKILGTDSCHDRNV